MATSSNPRRNVGVIPSPVAWVARVRRSFGTCRVSFFSFLGRRSPIWAFGKSHNRNRPFLMPYIYMVEGGRSFRGKDFKKIIPNFWNKNVLILRLLFMGAMKICLFSFSDSGKTWLHYLDGIFVIQLKERKIRASLKVFHSVSEIIQRFPRKVVGKKTSVRIRKLWPSRMIDRVGKLDKRNENELGGKDLFL